MLFVIMYFFPIGEHILQDFNLSKLTVAVLQALMWVDVGNSSRALEISVLQLLCVAF